MHVYHLSVQVCVYFGNLAIIVHLYSKERQWWVRSGDVSLSSMLYIFIFQKLLQLLSVLLSGSW